MLILLLQFPIPENVSLQDFLRMVGHYSYFIPNSADMARHLHQRVSKGISWSWAASEGTLFRRSLELSHTA